TSVQPPNRRTPEPAASGFAGYTLRMTLRPAIGGARLRLRVCNTYGKLPLLLGDVRIALRSSGPDIRPDSARGVSFRGAISIGIAPGASILSDPVDLSTRAGEDLAVDLYLATPSGPPTWHAEANRTSYRSRRGDHAGEPHWGELVPELSWYFICGLDVQAPRS